MLAYRLVNIYRCFDVTFASILRVKQTMKISNQDIRGIENLGNKHSLMGRNITEELISEKSKILIISISPHNKFAPHTCRIPTNLKHAKLFLIGKEGVVSIQ
jgi:hypothetical protein